MVKAVETLTRGLSGLKLGFDRKAYHARKAACPRCGRVVCAHHLSRHQRTQKCKLITFWTKNLVVFGPGPGKPASIFQGLY